MSALGTREEQENKTRDQYSTPVAIRNYSEEIPLEKALVYSTIAHPVIPALLWLLFKLFVMLLLLLGITLPLFDRPKPKVRDIEFVLVNKEEKPPIDPNTKLRAERNSRAGGKHDPTKAVSQPEPTAVKSTPQKAQPSTPRVQPRRTAPRRQASKPSQQQAEDTPVPPRPVPHHSIPRPNIARPNVFSVPIPPAKAPKAMGSNSGGPVTSGPMGDSSPSSSPAPIMGSSGSQGRRGSGYSPGGGNPGNPGMGNPNGSPGIDAIREPDFGTYMAYLQRSIKRNWNPPKGNESKRVVLMFKVAKDGRLLELKVHDSSGNPETDRAAIGAVQVTAPFRRLPPEYRGSNIDIQFTFDYNVVGVRRN